MRKFDYITLGDILNDLRKEGLTHFQRVTFYRLEKKLKFPLWDKEKYEWRRYTPKEAEDIKNMIKVRYRLKEVQKVTEKITTKSLVDYIFMKR